MPEVQEAALKLVPGRPEEMIKIRAFLDHVLQVDYSVTAPGPHGAVALPELCYISPGGYHLSLGGFNQVRKYWNSIIQTAANEYASKGDAERAKNLRARARHILPDRSTCSVVK